MAAAQIKNEAIENKKKGNRRRKKRRTEDFSSDSSSSSSDDDDSMDEASQPQETEIIKIQPNINIDDIDIQSDGEETKNKPEFLKDSTKKELQRIKLTATTLTTNSKAAINSQELDKQLSSKRKELNNEYLLLLANNFDNDLDELRKVPDFNGKSLVLLAKTLQSGGNIFDEETLSSLLGKSN